MLCNSTVFTPAETMWLKYKLIIHKSERKKKKESSITKTKQNLFLTRYLITLDFSNPSPIFSSNPLKIYSRTQSSWCKYFISLGSYLFIHFVKNSNKCSGRKRKLRLNCGTAYGNNATSWRHQGAILGPFPNWGIRNTISILKLWTVRIQCCIFLAKLAFK